MANYDFFITRVGDDPTTPLEFYPPKGSDELHDALKRAYPHLPSLQARMREAVIEFYIREQDPYRELIHYTPDTTTSVSPSNLSSNELSFASTAYTPPTMESTPNSSDAMSSSTPSQQELMNVWTLSTSTQAKIHKRRNMTAEEKVKYKAKRLAGACNDCRRRRRKCEHDTSTHSERRKLSTSNPAKSRKLSTRASLKPATSPNVQPSSLNLENTFAANISSFETPIPFSAEMMAIDPSSLSLETSLKHEGIFEEILDFNTDFDLSPFLQNNMAEHGWEVENSWPEWFDSSQANIQHTSNWPTTRTQDLGNLYQQTLPIQQTVHIGQSPASAENDPSPFYSSSESMNFAEPMIACELGQAAQRGLLKHADESANHGNKSLQTSQALQFSAPTTGHAPFLPQISTSPFDFAPPLQRTNEFLSQCDDHHPTTSRPSSSRSMRPSASLTSPAETMPTFSVRTSTFSVRAPTFSGRNTPLRRARKRIDTHASAVELQQGSEALQATQTVVNRNVNGEETSRAMLRNTQRARCTTSNGGFHWNDVGLRNEREQLLRAERLQRERTVATLATYQDPQHEMNILRTHSKIWNLQINAIGARFQETLRGTNEVQGSWTCCECGHGGSPFPTGQLQLQLPEGWLCSRQREEFNCQVKETSCSDSPTLLPTRLIIMFYLARYIWVRMVGRSSGIAFAVLLSIWSQIGYMDFGQKSKGGSS